MGWMRIRRSRRREREREVEIKRGGEGRREERGTNRVL